MIGLLSKIFGGNKSDKDVKKLQPVVAEINRYYNEYKSLSNDDLRNKTHEFRQRVSDHLQDIDQQVAAKKTEAEAFNEDIQARETIYSDIDKLVKKRDEKN